MAPGRSAVWDTGFVEAYLVVMMPYFVVILSEAAFVIRQLNARRSQAVANAVKGDTGTATPGEDRGERQCTVARQEDAGEDPVDVRVVLGVTGFVAGEMLGLLFYPVWQGVPEGVVLWPAWRGQLWVVSVQGVVLLTAVLHSSSFYYSQANLPSDLGSFYISS